MSISITSAEFALLLGLSVFISILYYTGHRKNIKIIKAVSQSLENSLKPKDQEYTWLGGVLGFTGNYNVDGFEKVTASVFMLPRQSVLYLPFSYITTGYDRLEVLFFLKADVRNEIHLIRKVKPSYRMPTIYNADVLKNETILINEKNFILMYRNKTDEIKNIVALGRKLEPLGVMHIAMTPKKRVLYTKLQIKPKSVSHIETAMNHCLKHISAIGNN